MPRTIRFHLDENCSHAIAAGLRRRGIDVTTTPEMGQQRKRHVGDIVRGLVLIWERLDQPDMAGHVKYL